MFTKQFLLLCNALLIIFMLMRKFKIIIIIVIISNIIAITNLFYLDTLVICTSCQYTTTCTCCLYNLKFVWQENFAHQWLFGAKIWLESTVSTVSEKRSRLEKAIDRHLLKAT